MVFDTSRLMASLNSTPAVGSLPATADATDWEVLLQHIRSRTVIPFLGAGLSSPILPGWQTLIKEVAEKVKPPDLENVGIEKGNLPMITDMITETLVERLVKTELGIDDTDGSTRSPLGSELLEVFRKHLSRPCDNNPDLLDALLLGKTVDSIDCKDIPDSIRKATQGHRAITTGPWPLILTSNWDTFLEASYGMMGLNRDDVWDCFHPEKQYFHRKTKALPVRYRSDIQQVYAELQAGVKPPRLLKLHGDFTLKGSSELVAGHSDYRHLMVHDVSFARFMQYLCSQYNFLFYGNSLNDPDMLAVLDGMIESLGSEVGPHFWITAGPVSNARKHYLMKNYSVCTIRTKNIKDYEGQLALLTALCNQGWSIPHPLAVKTIEYKISGPDRKTEILVSVSDNLPENIACDLKRNEKPYALAVMVSIDEGGTPTVCHHSQNAYDCGLLNKSCVSASTFDMKSSNWRAQSCSRGCWIVCVQMPHKLEKENLQGIFEATQHFIVKAGSNSYEFSSTPQNTSSSSETLTLILPLLRVSDCLVQHEEVLCAMLSAIGDATKQIVSHTKTIRIVIALGVPTTGRNRIALFAEIDAGRIHVGRVLNRSLHGQMEFTCISPACSYSQQSCDERRWLCRKLYTDIKGSFRDLRKQMGYPDDCKETRSLLEANITDGSSFIFNPFIKAD